jgi:DNA repair protein RecO (recombination protein O)
MTERSAATDVGTSPRRSRGRTKARDARIVRESAIVLRMSPVTNSSCMVQWLTSAHGRISTLVKGGYRRKSPFLGQVDLYRTCELLYYAPLRPDQPGIAREVAVLAARNGLRTQWRSTAVASYLCDLAGRVSVEPTAGAGFDRLNRALDALDAGRSPGSILLWFELRMAEHLGWRPRLESCTVCSRPATGGEPVLFSPGLGGLVCASCRSARSADGIEWSARLLTRIRERQDADRPDGFGEIRLSLRDILRVERALGLFLEHHLDLPPAARAIAFECLRAPAVKLHGSPAVPQGAEAAG